MTNKKNVLCPYEQTAAGARGSAAAGKGSCRAERQPENALVALEEGANLAAHDFDRMLCQSSALGHQVGSAGGGLC